MTTTIARRGSTIADLVQDSLASPGPQDENVRPAEAPARVARPITSKPAPKDDGPWLLAACVSSAPLVGAEEAVAAAGNGKQMGPVHQGVTAIAFVRARVGRDQEGETLTVVECRAGGDIESDEGKLLSGFWAAFNKWRPRLVTFNGRGHLLPLMRFASMRNGLTAKWLHDAGNGREGYGARYSTAMHVDLMDQFSDCHASPFPSMVDACFALALPTPPPQGHDDPRGRAEACAAIVFLLHVRWQLYTGKMGPAAYSAAVASLIDACDLTSPSYLGTMLSAWINQAQAETPAASEISEATGVVTGS